MAKVEKGDLIRIVDSHSYMRENGEIHEVIDAPTHVNGVTIKGGDFVADGEYEVHHKASAGLPNGVIAVFSDEEMRNLMRHVVPAKSNKQTK